MTLSTYRRDAGATTQDGQTHIFTVGQIVRLKHRHGTLKPASETFEVTARVPARGNSPQYRVRSGDERHERMMTQDDLEAVEALPEGSSETLIERTFGNGQGTKTQ